MSKKGSKQTYYTKDWEVEELYPDFSKWVSGTPGSTTFSCRICSVTKDKKLGNMGRRALTKHQDSLGHKKAVEENRLKGLRQPHIGLFSSRPSQAIVINDEENSSVTSPPSSVVSASNPYFNSPSVLVKRTTILLALKAIVSNLSYRCIEGFVELFPLLFPDSDISSQINLKRSKLSYILKFGLAIYYKNILFASLIPSNGVRVLFVSCFDEAFNRIAKRKQMDLHVFYFDETKEKVVRSYIGASFMGHATSQDTVTSFIQVHEKLDIVHNLIQVSMDGPNVNWLALKYIEEYRKTEDPGCSSLLNIGSCGLHVLHGAFGTAQTDVGWKVDKYCKNTYSIFKISPARREDYLSCNGLLESHENKDVNYLFPEKFCGHRWLENGKVLERAIVLHGNMKEYFKWLIDTKNTPKNDTRFELIEHKLGEKLLRAELEFSLYVARIIEPFLIFFQGERPLSVFLYEELCTLLKTLLPKFVKSDVLKENSTVKKMMKISLVNKDRNVILMDDKNLLPFDKVKVGHGAEQVLTKMKTVDALEVKMFRTKCRRFYAILVEKIKERSPLGYKLTCYLSSMSPNQILGAKKEILDQNFNLLCQHFVTCGVINPGLADKAEESYNKFIRDKTCQKKLEKFDQQKDRIDDLYMPLLKNSRELREVVKIVLILSHGNARVESGFSINKDMLKDNMKESTLVAHRIIYDGVLNEGGLFKVEINKEMIKEVDNAYKRYSMNLEEEKLTQTAGEKRKNEKRQLTMQIKKAKDMQTALTAELEKKKSEVENEIAQLENQLRNK